MVSLSIINVKAYSDHTRWGTERMQIDSTGEDILPEWLACYTANYPPARVDALPVEGKVDVIDCRVSFVRGICVRDKDDLAVDDTTGRAYPSTTRDDC